LDTARQHLPNSVDSDEPAIAAMITAASRAIQKYCRRGFASDTYDELYNGNGDRRLILRQFPIIGVQSLRYRPVTVLKIQNNFANTPIARVAVTSTGIVLTRTTSGVAITDATLTFASNVTVLALQNAVNALGFGWTAAGAGYDAWPAADMYC